jgi:hypothetical protein
VNSAALKKKSRTAAGLHWPLIQMSPVTSAWLVSGAVPKALANFIAIPPRLVGLTQSD